MKLYEITDTQPSAYKTEITADEAWDLLNKHCKDALKDLDTPIVRGMRDIPSGLGVVQGDAGGRKSRYTYNFYTTILDAVLPSDFPKRSKSAVCANLENRLHAHKYGTTYALIPFDGVKIGVCPDYDMWHTPITLANETRSAKEWNDTFRHLVDHGDVSFNEIVSTFERYSKYEPSSLNLWYEKLKGKDIKAELTKAYSKPFKLATTKTSKIYNDGKKHELWIGGKCVAIRMDIYKKMMKNPKNAAMPWD